MESVNFKLVKPKITSKKFTKNAQGNYVLSYTLGHANIKNHSFTKSINPFKPIESIHPSNTTKLTTALKVVEEQKSLEKTVPMTNQTRVMNILNQSC